MAPRVRSAWNGKARIAVIIIGAVIVLAVLVYIFMTVPLGHVSYSVSSDSASSTSTQSTSTSLISSFATSTLVNGTSTLFLATSTIPEISPFVVTHILTPEAVRGIYYTSWAAGTPSFRAQMLDLLSSTTLNAVVIDVKDYSGRIAFPVEDKKLIALGAVQKRIPDMKELIGKLHDKGIYVIGRVAVFQDPYLVKVKPEWAVHDKRTGEVWKDSGGAFWLDPHRKEVWDYIVSIARESYAVGFDEINFDYIRFPSDGAVSSAVYAKASTTKASVIREFFSYLHKNLGSGSSTIPISADVFGQTTTDPGDMGIGQHFEYSLPFFNAVSPMVYPSHYIRGFAGYEKPAAHPYEIVKYAMDGAVERNEAASSTSISVMRPWLQAFDLGGVYTSAMVRDQIRATYDAGANSWLLWNAGSVYKKDAFLTPVQKSPVIAKKIKINTATSTTATSTSFAASTSTVSTSTTSTYMAPTSTPPTAQTTTVITPMY